MPQTRKVNKITLSYSVLSAWRKCPTYFKLRYLRELQKPFIPKEPTAKDKGSALQFGDAFHRSMEMWGSGKYSKDQILEFAHNVCKENGLTAIRDQNDRSGDQLVKLVGAYIDHFGPALQDFKPIDINGKSGLEYEYDEDFSDIINWRLHFDGLVEVQRDIEELGLEKGEIVILEYKTASDLLFNLRSRMFSDQAIGYSRQATRLLNSDKPIPVVFVGVCSKQSALKGVLDAKYWQNYVKRYKKEPPLLFMRQVFRPDAEMHDEWYQDVMKDCARLIEDIESMHFTRNAPDACTVFGGLCQFHQICKITPSTRQQVIDLMYEEESWKGFEVDIKETD